ncbi:MAG: RDD family protein [Saprospiraceae bacterium]|nr:RDD family protein [Saprospiraceae bacterium]
MALVIGILLMCYKPFMEFQYGATLGKMAVKLKVVNLDFEKITLSQSIIRYIPGLWFTPKFSYYLLTFPKPRI